MTSTSRRALFGVGSAVAAAGIGGLGARDAREIYLRLNRPPWAPPPGVFGPVWSVLYGLIGLAGFRLAGSPARTPALALHLVQLALNAAWPASFFRAGTRRGALAIIVSLDVALAAEIALALRRDRTAALALAPYWAWSAYATALTRAVSDPAGAR